MSSNRRYPQLGAQLAEERELREARESGPLQSLTDAQLRLGREVVSIVPDGAEMWGRAWLRFGPTDVRACVRVMRWTSDAVGVEVEVGGDRLRCWVWQGAVEHLASREDAWR
jgi:hypothetical protein